MTLFPVIMRVPEDVSHISGTEKVALLSRIARQALKLSADRSGVVLGELCQAENGIPLPFGNHYWSLSHKPEYVAAVISDHRIGIDIEEIKPRTESLFSYVASAEEWQLGQNRSWETFFRYWTAKEAVLKAGGIGVSGLKACQVVSIPDRNNIVLKYQEHSFQVEQLHYDSHIVSVVKDDTNVEWVISETGEGLSCYQPDSA